MPVAPPPCRLKRPPGPPRAGTRPSERHLSRRPTVRGHSLKRAFRDVGEGASIAFRRSRDEHDLIGRLRNDGQRVDHDAWSYGVVLGALLTDCVYEELCGPNGIIAVLEVAVEERVQAYLGVAIEATSDMKCESLRRGQRPRERRELFCRLVSPVAMVIQAVRESSEKGRALRKLRLRRPADAYEGVCTVDRLWQRAQVLRAHHADDLESCVDGCTTFELAADSRLKELGGIRAGDVGVSGIRKRDRSTTKIALLRSSQ